MAKLFEKQRTNFYYNWLSFIEDFLKSLLVCFLMGHSVYIYIYIYIYIHIYVSILAYIYYDGVKKLKLDS